MAARKRVLIPGFFVRIIFPFIGLFFTPALRAQSGLDLPEQLTADVIDTKGLTQKLAGNVKLRYKGVILFCDQALHNVATHSISAYGHVLAVQGDSITARGDSATFAYSDQQLRMYGRVMFQDHRTTLTSTQLNYDLSAGVVTYTQKARIVDDKNVLTSLKGTYNVQLKQFTCQQSVQLATRKNTVKSESLVYNTVTQHSAILPKVIYPAVTEQRIVGKSAPQTAAATVPIAATRRPAVDPMATVAEYVPVAPASSLTAKSVATAKPVSSQPLSAPKLQAVLVTTAESRKVEPARSIQAQTRHDVTFPTTVSTGAAPLFRQAVHSTPARPSANAYTTDLSDLERELNKKKRFH